MFEANNKFYSEAESSEKKESPFEYIDRPSKTDILNISNHIHGLANFLVECATPMTISIQGKWGSGKSCIMRQVKEKIEDEKGRDVFHLWIDTWQFSQFPFDDKLSIIILNQLIAKIDQEAIVNKSSDSPFKSLKSFGGKLLEGGKQASKHYSGIDIDELWGNSLYNDIEKFKNEFKQALDKTVHERFVIYIDDLDRLVPEKAVELLEALKVFFNVEKCVFVLAIDYEVVSRGVAAKYGFDINNVKELEKGEDFFDKIIQVSYSVPLKEYDYENFIKNFLRNENLNNDHTYAKRFENLLISSVGKNPRSIKKILNTFKLNKVIKDSNPANSSSDSSKDTSEEDLVLFAFLCMQTEYPNIYSYVYGNIELSSIEEIIESLFDINIDNEDKSNLELIKDLEKPDTWAFLETVNNILLEIKDKKVLSNIFNISRTTFVDKKVKDANKETSLVNPEIQYLIRKMFNKVSSHEIIDLSEGIYNIISNLPIDKRTSNINEIKLKELGLDYVQLTQGKGQGIYLIKGDKYQPDYKIYFSGDNKGNFPNAGLRFIKEGYKDIVIANSEFRDANGQKYDASNLIDNQSYFDAFFYDYIEKIKILQERARDSKVIG